MITVRLPATLQVGTVDTLVLTEPIGTIADLIAALERRMPGFRDRLEEGVFHFAVNGEAPVRSARPPRLADGDRVDIVPAPSH